MKKLLFFVIMILLISPIMLVSAESGKCGDNLTWTLDDQGTLIISGTGDMYDYTTSSGDSPAPWHSLVSTIKSIEINDGVTYIGRLAFYECFKLSAVTMTDSVTSIGNNAFAECSTLYKITLSKNITEINNSVFANCSNLKEIVLPDKLVSIGDYAFMGCRRFNSPIPDNVTSIGKLAFSYCQVLKNVVIPGNVVTIDEDAFFGCKYLESISIPKSVKTINSGAFSNCDSLKTVYINDLAAWCNIDFANVSANPTWPAAAILYLNEQPVTNLKIPDSVTAIKKYTFYNCDFITSVFIPTSVTSVNQYAFYHCNNITDLYMPVDFKDTQIVSVSADARRYYCTVTYTGLITDTILVEYGKSVILPSDDYNLGYSYVFTSEGEAWDGKNITANVTVIVSAKTTVSMSAESISGGINYNYSIVGQTQTSDVLYIAVYDNSNKLLAIKAHTTDVVNSNGTLTITGTPSYCKAFLWNDNLKPISSTGKIIPQ